MGRKNYRRETKTENRKRESKRRETVPASNRKSVLTSAAWKLKPFKGFFSSMQLTENALTYQTRAHRALCPHITDFLLRANGKTRSFVSALSGPTNLFLFTGCMWGLQRYWYIVFPFTRIAAFIWSNIDTTEHSEKLGNDSRDWPWPPGASKALVLSTHSKVKGPMLYCNLKGLEMYCFNQLREGFPHEHLLPKLEPFCFLTWEISVCAVFTGLKKGSSLLE